MNTFLVWLTAQWADPQTGPAARAVSIAAALAAGWATSALLSM